jgi:hypothetical protein
MRGIIALQVEVKFMRKKKKPQGIKGTKPGNVSVDHLFLTPSLFTLHCV